MERHEFFELNIIWIWNSHLSMTQHLEVRSHILHPKNWLVISTPADIPMRYVKDKKTSFSTKFTSPLDNRRGNFSKHGVNKCATVRSWKSWHCNRSTALPQRILLKWLMPKAILKWGNQQEAIHRFNCHLFPWPISSNTRRLEYQLLFKVASHSNNSIFATATLLILQLFFYGRIRLIMPICNSCKSLSPFA